MENTRKMARKIREEKKRRHQKAFEVTISSLPQPRTVRAVHMPAQPPPSTLRPRPTKTKQ